MASCVESYFFGPGLQSSTVQRLHKGTAFHLQTWPRPASKLITMICLYQTSTLPLKSNILTPLLQSGTSALKIPTWQALTVVLSEDFAQSVKD